MFHRYFRFQRHTNEHGVNKWKRCPCAGMPTLSYHQQTSSRFIEDRQYTSILLYERVVVLNTGSTCNIIDLHVCLGWCGNAVQLVALPWKGLVSRTFFSWLMNNLNHVLNSRMKLTAFAAKWAWETPRNLSRVRSRDSISSDLPLTARYWWDHVQKKTKHLLTALHQTCRWMVTKKKT